MELNKKELVIICSLTLFAVVWIVFIVPTFMQSTWYKNQIPPTQYLLYNLGFITLFVVFLGFPITYYVQNKKLDILNMTRLGLGSWLGVSMIFDLLQPPFFVDASGTIIIDNPNALTNTAVDMTIIWVLRQLGVSGPLLFYFTYILVPVLIVFVLALLLAPKHFIGLFKK